MIRRTLAIATLIALSGAAPLSGWDEIAWTLPRDAWPAGIAYRCRDCDIQVYIRPKIGFCNCTTGITDDGELDAVSDMDMITPDFEGPAPGIPVIAAGLHGRARTYILHTSTGERTATGVALSAKCDLLVAAAFGRDAADQSRIAALLNTPRVTDWIAKSLGRKPQSS